MASSATVVKDEEHIRHCILFAYNMKKTAKEAHEMICSALGKDIISLERCEAWYDRFESGDFNIQNSIGDSASGDKKFKTENDVV